MNEEIDTELAVVSCVMNTIAHDPYCEHNINEEHTIGRFVVI